MNTAPMPAPVSAVRRLAHPLQWARARLRQWWQARLPLTDTWTLNQRNVYILPTRAGLMLALTLLVLLVGSINYQLNLGYLLTFLLAGSAAVGMHVGHGTLRGLTLHLSPPEPAFAGQAAALDVTLGSTRRSPRHAIALGVAESADRAWTDVPGQGTARVRIAWRPVRRGRQAVPALTAETRFPLGSFRVWTIWRPASELLVFPAPELRPPPLPPGEPRPGSGGAAASRSAGEFDGVRAYRRGDPLKLVVWKKFAKADELVSRDTEQAQRLELWLDHGHTGLSDPEARLSRLCAWVLAADERGLDYGLRLPGLEIAPAGGAAHRRHCLEALATC